MAAVALLAVPFVIEALRPDRQAAAESRIEGRSRVTFNEAQRYRHAGGSRRTSRVPKHNVPARHDVNATLNTLTQGIENDGPIPTSGAAGEHGHFNLHTQEPPRVDPLTGPTSAVTLRPSAPGSVPATSIPLQTDTDLAAAVVEPTGTQGRPFYPSHDASIEEILAGVQAQHGNTIDPAGDGPEVRLDPGTREVLPLQTGRGHDHTVLHSQDVLRADNRRVSDRVALIELIGAAPHDGARASTAEQ